MHDAVATTVRQAPDAARFRHLTARAYAIPSSNARASIRRTVQLGDRTWQHQAATVMKKMFLAGKFPEVEYTHVRRRVRIGIQVQHAVVVGKPDRMSVPRIQARIFELAQTPSVQRPHALMAIRPVVTIVRMASQILPGQRRLIEVQHVEVRSRAKLR